MLVRCTGDVVCVSIGSCVCKGKGRVVEEKTENYKAEHIDMREAGGC